MTKHVTQLGGVAVALLAFAASASADIKVTDNFSVAGYAAGSYRYLTESKSDKFDIDAAKISLLTKFAPVSGVASIYYQPGSSPDETTLLDLYATYDAGNGVSITGGKFLSWLGYEAFDIPNMSQITYANGDWLAPIPGYHSGLKLNYSDKEWSTGVAILDSVYGGLKGDGHLKGGAGYEAFVSYTGIEGVTLWLGAAFQEQGDYTLSPTKTKIFAGSQEKVTTIDFWASYQATKELLLAAEYVKKDGYAADGYNWLLFANYGFNEKCSATFRVSGENVDRGPRFTKFTLSPSHKITDNLTIRAEVSYYDYSKYSTKNDTFFGVQGVFKF